MQDSKLKLYKHFQKQVKRTLYISFLKKVVQILMFTMNICTSTMLGKRLVQQRWICQTTTTRQKLIHYWVVNKQHLQQEIISQSTVLLYPQMIQLIRQVLTLRLLTMQLKQLVTDTTQQTVLLLKVIGI